MEAMTVRCRNSRDSKTRRGLDTTRCYNSGKVSIRRLFCIPLLLLSPGFVHAEDWPQFRGPAGMGVSADKKLPTEFGPNKNVIWKTELPAGHSSPILVGPRIFLTAYQGDTLYTISLDRQTGKILWRREAPRPRKETMQQTNGPASPSPVSDGRNVYVFFGDFGVICYGVDGDERWKAPLGPFNNANGHGSSPIVADDMLILICDQDTDSYLLALDKNTGKQRWRVNRPEVTRGYATPAVYRPATGPAELIVPGAYELIAYNLANGEKLWWVRAAWRGSAEIGAADRWRHHLCERLGNRRRHRCPSRGADVQANAG